MDGDIMDIIPGVIGSPAAANRSFPLRSCERLHETSSHGDHGDHGERGLKTASFNDGVCRII